MNKKIFEKKNQILISYFEVSYILYYNRLKDYLIIIQLAYDLFFRHVNDQYKIQLLKT